jgi:elongation factor 1-beta
MGIALVKLKVMPISPEVDLEALKSKLSELLADKVDSELAFEEEPIAFGLTALITGFKLDESKQIDPIQDQIKDLEDVNSAEVADFRRAFG